MNATLEHTAGAQWGSNTGASTVDAEKEHYNNDAASAWAGCAYAKFSYTIPEGHSITKATLTYSVNQGGKSGRDDIIYYMKKDFDIDWANFAGQTGVDLRNTDSRAGKAVAAAPTGGTGDRIGLSQDVTEAVKAIYEGGQNYIIFQWTGNAGAADLYGKASEKAPTLVITTTAETLYEATFIANEGAISPTITVYSDADRTTPIAKNSLQANTTYYYTATLTGYSDYKGDFAVETSNPTVNFTMTAKSVFKYTVNAVDGSGNALGTVNSGSGYEGDAVTYYYPEFVLSGTTLYVKNKNGGNPYWGASGTLDADNKEFSVTYGDGTIEDVVFYKEAEAIEGFTPKTTNNATIRCSNGTGGIVAEDVVLTTLAPGKYKIFGQVWGTNGLTAGVKAGDKSLWTLESTGSLANSTSEEFTIEESTDLYVYTTGGNDNHMLDLIYIVKVPTTYAVTIAEGIVGGTVAANPTSAKVGDEVTLTNTPAEGYEFVSYSVTGVKSDEAVLVTDGKFTMPADDVTVNATFQKKVIYIETDLTSKFNSLATTQWVGSSGQVGWAAPKVTTNSGLEVAAWERYNGSCDWTGDIMSSSVTGLAPGTYKIELYGAAAFTFGRGFGSTAFTGDFSKDTSDTYKENESIDENTGVTLYAETAEGKVSKEIPIWYATNFNTSGIATATLENVIVGESGEIKIGLSKTSTSTNWHVVQLKGVTAQVPAADVLADAVAAAKAVKESDVPAKLYSEIQEAITTYDKEYSTADEYLTAINALNALVDKAEGYAPLTKVLNEGEGYKANVPAEDPAIATYDAAIADVKAAYDGVVVADIPAAVKVVEAALPAIAKAQTAPNSDMTRVIVNPTIDGSTGWTCERPKGGNGPLLNGTAFEYWAGNANPRSEATFDYYQVIEGLPSGKYVISAEMYNSLNGEEGAAFAPTSGVYASSGNDETATLVDVDGTELIRYATEEVFVKDGTLRLGVKNTELPMAARWFVADNFTLTLVEAIETYPIAYALGMQNGTVTGPTAAEAGEKVTLTVTPEEGYELESLKITCEVSGNEINYDVTDYSFTMPEEGVYVIGTFQKKIIYIETDLTSKFNSLATTQWVGSSGQVGWAAPKVTTNSGLEVAAWERYNGSCDWTGDIMSSSVTGLAPGTYKIELYGAAAFTFGRGFGSTAFTGDFSKDTSDTYKENESIDENTGVTLYAETAEGKVSKEIPIWYATNFNTSGIATATLENVIVGESGEIKIGLSKTSTSTNWHVVQLKGVTAQVPAADVLADAVAAAKAVKESDVPAKLYSEIQEAITTYDKEYSTADEYLTAINALNALVDKAEGYAPLTKVLNEGEGYKANVPAEDPAIATYDAAIADVKAAYDGVVVADIPAAVKVVEAALPAIAKAQTAPNSDMTRVIVNPTIDGSTGWTCERPKGGNGPLLNGTAFEYWAGNANPRSEATFDYYQVIEGLPSGKYVISAEMYNSLNGEEGAAFAPTSGVYASSGNDETATLVDVDGTELIRYATEEVFVKDGTLRLGVKNTELPMAARWFVADNFTLTLVEAIETYPIAYALGMQNGTVTGPTAAEAGEKVTLTVTPEEGYELESLKITCEVSGNEINYDVTDYSFTMPEEGVYVIATFKSPTGINAASANGNGILPDGKYFIKGKLTIIKGGNKFGAAGVAK